MDKIYEKSETGCCQRFNPEPWDKKEINWKDKLFIKDHVRCIFHIPLNFGKVIVKNMGIIKEADAFTPQPLMLSDEKSLWSSDIYISVNKEIKGAKISKISGKFLTKVFEGPYKNAKKWTKEMKDYVKEKNKNIKKIYYFYTTCPKCAKFYGKNYVVIFAEV
ncbi:MAG: hypothetical protein ISS82_02435 [Nanoarchaeota archaeon]|nr:hypothetical protein [Nanoarchaeota archaeon]